MSFRLPFILAALVLCLSGAEPAPAEQSQPDSVSKLGVEHAILQKLVGTWKVRCKFWNEPGATPVDADGNATNVMILDGHFLQQDFQGTLAGTALLGRSIYGYDRISRSFTIVSVSNANTSMTLLNGTASRGGAAILYSGSMADPESDTPVPVKAEISFTGPDSYTYEMFMKWNEKETKSAELIFTRAK